MDTLSVLAFPSNLLYLSSTHIAIALRRHILRPPVTLFFIFRLLTLVHEMVHNFLA